MKLNRLIIVIVCLAFSCQKEVEVIQEDWVKDIDNAIAKYNKNAKIEFSKVLKENKDEYTVQFYHKDAQGFQRITTFMNIDNFIDITKEMYLLDDVLIMEKANGISPLIYKGRKKITDPCCELFEKRAYYKSSTEGKIYSKQLKIMNSEEKEINTNDLETMIFKENEQQDIAKEFSRSKDWIEEIKKSLL